MSDTFDAVAMRAVTDAAVDQHGSEVGRNSALGELELLIHLTQEEIRRRAQKGVRYLIVVKYTYHGDHIVSRMGLKYKLDIYRYFDIVYYDADGFVGSLGWKSDIHQEQFVKHFRERGFEVFSDCRFVMVRW